MNNNYLYVGRSERGGGAEGSIPQPYCQAGQSYLYTINLLILCQKQIFL